MRTFNYFILSLLVVGFLNSCSNNKTATAIKNWEGTYTGLLPCADCPGILQSVTLNADSTYSIKITYLESEDVAPKTMTGKFSLKGNVVTLLHPIDGGTYSYELNANTIKYLDANGKPYEGKLADAYELLKNAKVTIYPGDWEGTYFGTLPCADCEGIEYELTLNGDYTYQMITHYIAEGSEYDTISGPFTWNEDQTVIQLGGTSKDAASNLFKVEEDQVRYLDTKGKVITGELEENYILKKEGNKAVEDKKWDLVSLNGEKISDTNSTHFYIQFHAKDGRVEVKANCNLISFGYKITDNTNLKIEHGMSTMMACPESKDEDMMKAMENVRSFSLENQTLRFLDQKGNTIATFQLEE